MHPFFTSSVLSLLICFNPTIFSMDGESKNKAEQEIKTQSLQYPEGQRAAEKRAQLSKEEQEDLNGRFFHVFYESPDLERIALFLQQGADPNDDNAGVPYSIARYMAQGVPKNINYEALLSLLHCHGLNINNAVTPHKETFLMIAAKSGEKEVSRKAIKVLLQFGAHPNALDSEGRSALHVMNKKDDCSHDEFVDIIKDFVNHGADIDMINTTNDRTPLFEAVIIKENYFFARALLSCGANPFI